jgi:large subunit ribosomal protein L25
MSLSIECKQREAGSKPNALRRAGHIPANLYGHKGAESIHLTVDAKTVELLMRKAKPNHTAIEVSIPELSWKGTATVAEIQTHPWKNYPYHVSLFASK